jgi:hypothetical protein
MTAQHLSTLEFSQYLQTGDTGIKTTMIYTYFSKGLVSPQKVLGTICQC